MHRSELNQVAHGLKAVKPKKTDVEQRMGGDRLLASWEAAVTSIADHLQLKNKARSNFLAAAGLIHAEGGAS